MKAVDYLGQIATDEPSYPYNYPPESPTSVRPPPTPPNQHEWSPRTLTEPSPNDPTAAQPYSARANISPYNININSYGQTELSPSGFLIPDLIWQGGAILLGSTLGYFSERYYPQMHRVEGYGALIGAVLGNGVASWYLELKSDPMVNTQKWLASTLLPLSPIAVMMYTKTKPSPSVTGGLAAASVAIMYLADQQMKKEMA